jgi:Zn-dependent protease
MRDHVSWSISLGRWGGIRVRLHMAFLLFAAFTYYLSWREADARALSSPDWITVASLAVLLVSVLLHELGHLWAASRVGGNVDPIVLGPLGGLGRIAESPHPRAALLAHLAGPFANLVVCLVCVPVLMWASADVPGLLHPLAPEGLTAGSQTIVVVKLGFWINWGLALVNLLPAFPFDGGWVLRSAILLKWPQAGRHAASLLVAYLAKFAAVGLVAAALVLRLEDVQGLVSPRFALILLAIFLFFSAQHEERRADTEQGAADPLDGEPSADLAELERQLSHTGVAPSGPVKRWLEHRREIRLRRQHERESEEDRCVDEILARLHRHGIQSLSPEDRALLERVGARYRSRSQS